MANTSMALGWLVGRTIAGQRQKSDGNIIPAGGTYYIGVTGEEIGDYTGATTVLTAGHRFPNSVSTGDVFVFGDYEYRYGGNALITEDSWFIDSEMHGWGVRVIDKTKTAYGTLLSSIINQPLITISYAFYNCINLLTIPTIPSSVVQANESFMGCDALTAAVIPESITEFRRMFTNCDKLIDVTFLNQPTVLDTTFAACYALENVVIPDSVTEIGSMAFYQTSLTKVVLPDNVVTIGNQAFCLCKKLESAVIPYGVTTIGDYAFDNCLVLSSVNIPSSVTTIGEYAFRSTAIRSVIIPDGVTIIPKYCFCGCSQMESVTIPSSVTTIDSYAFYNCGSLMHITIPENVVTIGDNVCQSSDLLTTVTVLAKTPPTLKKGGSTYDHFASCPALTKIVVPAGCGSVYKANTGWKNYASLIVEQAE